VRKKLFSLPSSSVPFVRIVGKALLVDMG
jgi:hypothetical protein